MNINISIDSAIMTNKEDSPTINCIIGLKMDVIK